MERVTILKLGLKVTSSIDFYGNLDLEFVDFHGQIADNLALQFSAVSCSIFNVL